VDSSHYYSYGLYRQMAEIAESKSVAIKHWKKYPWFGRYCSLELCW